MSVTYTTDLKELSGAEEALQRLVLADQNSNRLEEHMTEPSRADLAPTVDFWKSQLAGPPDVQRLTAKNSTVTSSSRDTLESTIELAPTSYAAASLESHIVGAWALTLSQYLESEDVIFGILSAAGRSESETPLVPARVIVKREESVRAFLQRLHNESVARLPFEHLGIRDISNIDSDCDQACQFESFIEILPRQHSGRVDKVVQVENSHNDASALSSFPVMVACRPDDRRVTIELSYETNSVGQPLAQRILHQFKHMLQQVFDCSQRHLETKLGSLELVSHSDKEQLMQWNSGKFSPVDDCIHTRVHQQALVSPDSPAVQGWDASFTYRELDDLSTRLGAHLVRLGVDEKPIIPLCFNKSAWTVVAMLAVLKIGGAYVALDTSHPHDRLRLMVGQTRATTMLVAPDFEAVFQPHVKQVVVLQESLRTELLRQPSLFELPAAQPSDPAIICFTSGSTGLPKGVVLLHGAFCTLAASVGPGMRFTSKSRVLQFAGYAFDVSNSEIFLTLMHGGCCCIPSDHERMNDLAGAISRMGINWLFLTPTVAGMMSPEDLGDVQTLMLGGEAVRQDLIDRFVHHVRLMGCYGPAEGTIWPSFTCFEPNSDPTIIGSSGAGCHMWLVDPADHNRLVPIGVAGEILLEGPMVAKGYLFDEAKTRVAFIEPPSWAADAGYEAPRRFYKVGDLARQRLDGSLSFVGRRDTQVKIRGQRIELGEIESRLSARSDIIAAVAADVVSLSPQSKTLVAFFCPSKGLNLQFKDNIGIYNAEAKESLRGLRTELAKSVTSSMVPSFFMPLERLPMSPSRKLDRKRLRQYFETLPARERREYRLG